MTKKPQPTALISVFYKDGIAEFAQRLVALGWKIMASGGTAKHLAAAGITVTDVADIVGKAILGHRVVTLSREVHAGLLSRPIPEDQQELEENNIEEISLVCVDLYPLEEEIAKSDATLDSILEKMDIGGPTMLSSGSKGRRIVICDPADREMVLTMIEGESEVANWFANDLVEHLAAKADFVVSRYRALTTDYRSNGHFKAFHGNRVAICKYGENAWQTPAALYSSGTDDPFALDKFKVIEGAPPSYNNWVDIDRLLQTASHIARAYAVNEGVGTAIAVGGKHGNSCGAAAGPDGREVLQKMMAGDPLSIFGGLILFNRELTEELAQPLAGKMLDGIIAPSIKPEAIAMLRRKGDKCRFITNPALTKLTLDQAPRFRHVRGGFLVQPNYTFVPDLDLNKEIKKYGQATVEQETDMMLAWAIGSTSNSNTITIVKNEQLLGNGVGQQDRVGAAKLAIERATRSGHDLAGAIAYSDSFFPFPDAPEILINAGIKAIFTSSGSVKDQLTTDLCRERGVVIYMVPDKEGRGFFGH